MSNSYTSNYVNISALPKLEAVTPGEYFVVKTNEGDSLIDYNDLPFVTISGNDVLFTGTLSSTNLVVTSLVSANSAYFQEVYINGVSGLSLSGTYNQFVIDSGIITSAANVPSIYYNSLSATFNTRLNQLSAGIPQFFVDGGIVILDGSQNTPVYSETIRGNVTLPQGVYISPSDINIKYLWNTQLDTQFTTTFLSSFPLIFVEENSSNNYVDSNRKVQFRAILRPPLMRPARVAWNIIKAL